MGKKWDEYFHSRIPVAGFLELLNRTFLSRVLEKKLCKYTPKEGLFLEPGCGSGILSSRLGKKGCKTIVLDISYKALMDTRNNYLMVKTTFIGVRGDINRLPFKDEMFDCTWNAGVIEHFPDPKEPLSEMVRVTKKGGRVIAFTPSYLSLTHIAYIISNKCNLRLWPYGYQYFFKKKDLEGFLVNLPLKQIVVKRLVETCYLTTLSVSERL